MGGYDADDDGFYPAKPRCPCGEEIQSNNWNHCPACGKEILTSDFLTNPVGTWEVTTEGDCEGRTTKQLGVHDGHILDVARNLANHVGYGLHFRKLKISRGKTVQIHRPVEVKIGVDPPLSLAQITTGAHDKGVKVTAYGSPGGFSLMFQ